MKHPETQAREAFLHSCYGKFDIVVSIIPQELLLKGKPRRIKEWLVKNLQIKEADINSNTLRSWLYRYRWFHKRISDQTKNLHWQEFKPSVTKPLLNDQTLVIKKVSNQ